MFYFPNFFNLGELADYLTRLAGIWTLAGQYMATMRAVGLSIWSFVTAYGFYERFRWAEDPMEYAYSALRAGLSFGAITYWPELFGFFKEAFHAWADSIPYQTSMQALLQALVGHLLDPVKLAALALLGPLGLLFQIPFLIFLFALLFFLFAYIYLLIYQAVSLSIAFIFGPVALALYPSVVAGKLTAGYLKATIKILLLPLLFAIFLDAFARTSVELFRKENFGFIQSAVLILIAYTTLKLPKILDRLDTTLDTAGHYAGGLMVSTARYLGGFAGGLALRGAATAVGSLAGPGGAAAGATMASVPPTITSPRVNNPVT